MTFEKISEVAVGGFGHGKLLFKQGWSGGFQELIIYGGPYNKFPGYLGDEAFGVCVRAENTHGRHIDAHVPIEDFQVPTPDQAFLVLDTLKQIIQQSLAGKVVYIGCAGGYGRTGLFLAILAKA